MKYVKGSVFPYTERYLREDNPNTSFPKNALANESVRTEYGVEEVSETAVPVKNGYKAVRGEIGTVDGKRVEVWDLVVKDVEELQPYEVTKIPANPPEGNSYLEGEPELVDDEWVGTWVYKQESGVKARELVYGPPTEQIEFITENGLEAWQARVAEIKAKYPK